MEKNPPNKTYLLKIKAKLFSLRVTFNYISLQKMERICILAEKRKKKKLADVCTFCKYIEKVRK